MTIHYHGTPITPRAVLDQLAGRFFCVSYVRPDSVRAAHDIGQGVLLDNGAFSVWRRGATPNWPGYYAWADKWLAYPTTWAVIPDVIGGTEEENDGLLTEWPHGDRGAPVWHLHEPVDRLLRLTDGWSRVCFGSSGQYASVGSAAWHRRVSTAWDSLGRHRRRVPWVHMLRGMRCVTWQYPFASVDSTDIARNHSSRKRTPREMVDRWDAMQCPPTWNPTAQQMEMFA